MQTHWVRDDYNQALDLPEALLEDIFVFDSKPLLLINDEQTDILEFNVR